MLHFDFFAQPMQSFFHLLFLIAVSAITSLLANIAINAMWRQFPINQALSLSLSQLASLNFMAPVITVVLMTTYKLSIISSILVGVFAGTFIAMTKIFLWGAQK